MANLSNINNKFLVTTGGNVGIGVTGPLYRLEASSSDFNFVGKFQATGTGYAPASILLETTGSASRGQGMYHYNTTADENWFTGVPYDVNSEKWIVANQSSTSQLVDTAQLSHALMTIAAGGNVGIGTTSPNFTLDVEADKDTWISRIYNTGSDANAQSLLIRSDATSAHDALVMGVYADSGYKMVVRSTGNVGIGETNPDTKLHIKSSTYDDFIKLERDGIGAMGISATNPRGIQTTDGAGGFLGWHVNSSGNVGIGTFSPSTTFQVNGSTNFGNAA